MIRDYIELTKPRITWLILMSTTNAGPDGNTRARVPSYFNLICEEIRAGKRSPEWREFTGTAYDNPATNTGNIVANVTNLAGQLDWPPGGIAMTAGITINCSAAPSTGGILILWI